MAQLPADMMGGDGSLPDVEAAGGGSTFGKDVLNASGGLAPLISRAIFSRKRRRLESKARHLENEKRLHDLNEGMTDLADAESEVRRQGDREPHALKARLAAMGASGGSQESAALEDQKYSLARRLNSIQRARARMKYGYEMGERFRHLQKQGDRLSENEQKLSVLIDTAAKVAAGAM